MSDLNPAAALFASKEQIDFPADAPPARGERKKLMKLEAIRGFAAVYVLCHHTLPKYISVLGYQIALFRYAQEAVMLFFILSGFVIQYAYLTSSDKSFKSFFLKRFLRIFIPLICVFFAHYVLLTVSHQVVEDSGIHSLIGNLLMLQQVPEIWLQPAWFEPFLSNKPLWTLSFEWWFYMMFFFFSYYFSKNSSKPVYFITLIAAITYIFFPNSVVREIMYFIIWWMGADMARLYVNNRKIDLPAMRTPLFMLAAVGLLAVCHYFYYQYQHPDNPVLFVTTPLIEIRHFGFCLIVIILSMLWRKINWLGFNYTFGWFEILAPISFSLYISHWYFVAHAHYLDSYIGNFYIRVLVYFIICCAFCYLVERIIYPKVSKKILSYFSVKKKSFVVVN